MEPWSGKTYVMLKHYLLLLLYNIASKVELLDILPNP